MSALPPPRFGRFDPRRCWAGKLPTQEGRTTMDWDAQRVEIRPRQVAEVLEEIQQGRSVTISASTGQGKSSMVAAIAEKLGARSLVVRIPPQIDNVEFTLLSIAEQLGPNVSRRVAR